MMETESASETLEYLDSLTWPSNSDDFIEERRKPRHLNIDGRIILKWITKK
jgi:hypothetical protein